MTMAYPPQSPSKGKSRGAFCISSVTGGDVIGGIMERWSDGVMKKRQRSFWQYSNTPLLHFHPSANQAPMRIERPVNKQPTPDQVFLRHWPPVTAVVTIVTVVAQREIAVFRHIKNPIRFRDIIAAQSVAVIVKVIVHYTLQSVTLSVSLVH